MKSKLILLICLISITSPAFTQPKPQDQIKFRQSGMMFMRWNVGIIKNQVVKNPQQYNKEKVVAAASAIAAVANSGIENLFTANSKTGKGWKKTRVKKAFFEEPQEVEKHVIKFKKEANNMLSASQGGDLDQIQQQFDVLFKACKGCHKKYRAKE